MKATLTPQQQHRHDDATVATAIATWPGDRPSIIRLFECRLFHRSEWQYLGTRLGETATSGSVDSYRCDRCEREWEKVP